MANTEYIRTIFEDNGFLTLDDSDFGGLFLAQYPQDMEEGDSTWTNDFPDICIELDLNFERIDSEIVAVFGGD